ncbi:MAG: hypothetical protein M3O34_03795 [Chloroflexota bacterium]|nr:hypothetical protein [Chloroflexota bacterium]
MAIDSFMNSGPRAVVDDRRPALRLIGQDIATIRPLAPTDVHRHAERLLHGGMAERSSAARPIRQGRDPAHGAPDRCAAGHHLEEILNVRGGLGVNVEHGLRRALAPLVVRCGSPAIPPWARPHRTPTTCGDVLTGGRNALPEYAHLLLSDTPEDVGDQVGYLATFSNGMDRHAEPLQLFAATDTLQQTTAEPIKSCDDYGH